MLQVRINHTNQETIFKEMTDRHIDLVTRSFWG
jgi:hypothetical protein